MWKDIIPDRLISACIEILVNIVTGVWCDKLAEVINCVREPLARLARVRPHYAVKVYPVKICLTPPLNPLHYSTLLSHFKLPF